MRRTWVRAGSGILWAYLGAVVLGAEGLLFHAGFDAADAPPATGSEVVPGRPGHFPEADRAGGAALPTQVGGVAYDPAGRFGGAARVAADNGLLSFDAAGNIRMRRGTLAFWVRRDGNPSQVLHIGALGTAPRGASSWLSLTFESGRMTMTSADGRTPRFSLAWAAPWEVGEWLHLALAWDAACGWRVYRDGRLAAAAWDRPMLYPSPALDNIAFGGIAGDSNMRPGGGLTVDEVWIFDHVLTEPQIAELHTGNMPPAQRNPSAPGQEDAHPEWINALYGLDDPGIPEWHGGSLAVRRARIHRVWDVRMPFSNPIDGKPLTGWPLTYKGYAQRNRVLEIPWHGEEPINYIRLTGDLSGTLRVGDAVLLELSGAGPVQRATWSDILLLRTARIERTEGRVFALDSYLVEEMKEPDPARPTARWYAGPPVPGLDPGPAGARVALREDPQDHILLPAAGHPPAPGALPIDAWKSYHLVGPPQAQDLAAGRWRLDLHLRGFPDGTVLLLQVHDPVTSTRRLLEFDVRLRTGGAGPGHVPLVFEGPMAWFEPGQAVHWTLLFDRPGLLLLGPDGTALSAFEASDEQKAHYREALRQVLSDQFLFMSEPGRWRASGGDPPRQFKGIGELFDLSAHLMHAFPGEETATAIYSWMLRWRRRWDPEAAARYRDPLENLTLPDPPGEGPEWAVWGRAALKALRRHVDWWVEERTIETGEIGSWYSDDTDLINDYVNFALIHDPGSRIRDAYRRLADYTWEHHLIDGISRRYTDHLHAFEEGTNIQHAPALMYYGHPEYIERLMITSRAYENHLTRVTPGGDRLFASTHFSATRTGPSLSRVDQGMIIVFQPARYLVWYNGSPRVLQVMREWQDTWMRLADAERARGRAVPRGPHNVNHNVRWMYEMTGDERYRDVYGPDEPLSREDLMAGLRRDTLHMRKYLPVHTWVGQSADRADIPLRHMALQYLGGMADKAKRLGWHYHHVSWEEADDDIARYVVEATPDTLKVLLYSFHEEPRDIVLRVWRLRHGLYRVRVGRDLEGDDAIDALSWEEERVLARYEPIPLRVPPRQVLVVEAVQREVYEDIRFRPDLALAAGDVTIDGDRLQVVVHNIGGAPSPAGRIRLQRAGRILAEKDIPPLEAPDDLVPRTATVVFDRVTDLEDLEIILNPDAVFEEITRVNNILRLAGSG